MIEKAIINLLESSRRVVLPDFGAFIKSPDFSEEIFFNQYIRSDDGILAHHIASQQHISLAEAVQEIATYVAGSKRALSEQGFVMVEHVGLLRMTGGKIELHNKVNPPAESPAPQKDAVRVPEADTTHGRAKPSIGKPMPASANAVSESAVIAKGAMLLILPLLASLFVIFYIAFVGRRMEKAVPEVPRPTIVQPPKGEQLRYHLIVGMYSEEPQADALVKALQRERFAARKIHHVVKGTFLVSAATFADLPDALLAGKTTHSKRPALWVMTFSD